MKYIKNNHWVDILALFTTRDELFAPFRRFVSGQGQEASEVAGTAPLVPVIDDLIQARALMRDSLDQLRGALAVDLNERDGYYILFPIVAHLDEEVQTRYVDPIQLGPEAAASLAAFMDEHSDYADPIHLSSWPSFQRELFDTNAAGEMFYQTIDDLLMKPQTLALIFEVYYFCLNDGFRGRLVNNPAKRQEYMDRLKSRIPQPSLEPEGSFAQETALRSHSFFEAVSPPWLYGGAIAASLVIYLALKGAGSSWNPILG